jgi:hypothetical protein
MRKTTSGGPFIAPGAMSYWPPVAGTTGQATSFCGIENDQPLQACDRRSFRSLVETAPLLPRCRFRPKPWQIFPETAETEGECHIRSYAPKPPIRRLVKYQRLLDDVGGKEMLVSIEHFDGASTAARLLSLEGPGRGSIGGNRRNRVCSRKMLCGNRKKRRERLMMSFLFDLFSTRR